MDVIYESITSQLVTRGRRYAPQNPTKNPTENFTEGLLRVVF